MIEISIDKLPNVICLAEKVYTNSETGARIYKLSKHQYAYYDGVKLYATKASNTRNFIKHNIANENGNTLSLKVLYAQFGL